ncbi:MAG: helix-turn-helix domain-containing protein, partial [Proteobacteria bacterium]|nr:helix-turn-helix domain-containing protein [Pseudomonadota bacterium]
MGSRYTHLQPEERITLASLHQQGLSQRAIGALLGRSPSTISRELRRNHCALGYASRPAQTACEQRRLAAR